MDGSHKKVNDQELEQVSHRCQGGERATASKSKVACLGNTPLQSSQVETFTLIQDRVIVDYDWLELGGVVEWNAETETLKEIQKAHDNARLSFEPESITLNGYRCILFPKGIGAGRQTRLKYRIGWGKTTLAFDLRENATRRPYNFQLTVPGHECLLRGATAVREWAHQVLELLGGYLVDEWIKRVDICMDIPDVNVAEELMPACVNRQYLTTSNNVKYYGTTTATESFSVGRRNHVELMIYNKTCETLKKMDPAYLEGMVKHRWHGTIPIGAPRVELRIHREWLRQWENDQAQSMIDGMGAIVKRLLGDDHRSFFKLLAEIPDRENKHQSRTEVHPLWDQIRTLMWERVGQKELELKRPTTGIGSASRKFAFLKSSVVSFALLLNRPIRSLQDVKEIVEEVCLNFGMNDQTWREHWQRKATEAGFEDRGTQFNFGANVGSETF